MHHHPLTRHVLAKKKPVTRGNNHRLINNLTLGIAVIEPFLTLPQVLKIFIEKNASGVSLISWTGYLLSAIIWLLYGLAHRDRAIIVNFVLWILFESLVIVGALLYSQLNW